jgi:hypothetical protein
LDEREAVGGRAAAAPQKAHAAPGPRLSRRLYRIFISLLRIYFIVCVGVFLIQDWMIFPGHGTQNSAEARIQPTADCELVHLKTADGTPVVGLFGAARLGSGVAPGGRQPAAIYFYGNAMSASGCMDEFDHLRGLGLSVIVAEYAGYGMSGGKPSEQSLYATADAMYDYLLSRADIDPKRIVPIGWSLGAAVATDLASRRPVAGLAIFSAFTSMPDMAQNTVPFLPARWLVSYRFDNLAKLPDFSMSWDAR